MTNPAQARPARTSLRAVGSLAAVGFGWSVWVSVTGLGLPCPFRALTGLRCPFCGGTTMGVALLRGDLHAALLANPLVLAACVALGVRTVGWIIEAFIDPPARAGRRWLPERVTRRALPIAVVVGVLYTIVRALW